MLIASIALHRSSFRDVSKGELREVAANRRGMVKDRWKDEAITTVLIVYQNIATQSIMFVI